MSALHPPTVSGDPSVAPRGPGRVHPRGAALAAIVATAGLVAPAAVSGQAAPVSRPPGTAALAPVAGGVFSSSPRQALIAAGVNAALGLPWRLELGGQLQGLWAGSTLDRLSVGVELARPLAGSSTAARILGVVAVTDWDGGHALLAGVRGVGSPELEAADGAGYPASPSVQVWVDVLVGAARLSRDGERVFMGVGTLQFRVAVPFELVLRRR